MARDMAGGITLPTAITDSATRSWRRSSPAAHAASSSTAASAPREAPDAQEIGAVIHTASPGPRSRAAQLPPLWVEGLNRCRGNVLRPGRRSSRMAASCLGMEGLHNLRKPELPRVGPAPQRRRHRPLEHGLSRPCRPTFARSGSGCLRRPPGPGAPLGWEHIGLTGDCVWTEVNPAAPFWSPGALRATFTAWAGWRTALNRSCGAPAPPPNPRPPPGHCFARHDERGNAAICNRPGGAGRPANQLTARRFGWHVICVLLRHAVIISDTCSTLRSLPVVATPPA